MWTGPKIGAASLGVFLGYIALYFIVRFNQFDTKVLGALFAILVGGSVVAFIGDKTARPYYPIGLVGGLALYIFVRVVVGGGTVPTFDF
jgi:lipopolysaccharide export LptBFGC system permease protein LptF